MTNNKQNKNGKDKNDENKYLGSITQYSYLIIISLTTILYFQVLLFDFTNYDDHFFRSGSAKLTNLNSAVTESYLEEGVYYRPVVNLSFLIDYQIGGESPFIYHLTNLILHCLASCLIFTLLKKLKLRTRASLCCALLFAVHPLSTNATVWIVGRTDMLAAIFFFTAFIFFINYIEKKKKQILILHGLSLVLASLSKEVAIISPFVMVAYWILFYRNKKSSVDNLLLYAVWTAALIIPLLLKYFTAIPMTDLNITLTNILENIRVIPEIVAKFILPFNLQILPKFDIATTVLGLVVLVFVMFLILLRGRIFDRKKILFGMLWFVVFLLPGMLVVGMSAHVSSGVYTTYDYLDCRAYLPLAGLLISLAAFIPNKTWDKRIIYVTFAAVIVLFSTLTFIYSGNYENPKTFRLSAFDKTLLEDISTFESEAKNKATEEGIKKSKKQDYKGAVEEFNKAIEIDSTDWTLYANRGTYRMRTGDIKGAIEDFSKVIETNSEDDKALFQRGAAKIESYDYKGAVEDFTKVIKIKADSYLAYYQRGLSRYYMEDFQGSIEDCNKVIELNANFGDAYLQKGLSEIGLGQKDAGCNNIYKARELGSKMAQEYILELCQ